MKNIISGLCIFFWLNADAQFTEMQHGYQIANVEDIEVGDNGNIIFATNNGILLYNGGTWKRFDKTNGLEDQHILTIEPYPGGFYFTAFNKLTGYCDYQNTRDTIFLTSSVFSHFSAIHIQGNDTLLGTNNGIVYRWNTSGRNIITQGTLGWVNDINLLSGTVDFHVISTSDKIYLYQASTSGGFIVSSTTTPIPSNNVLSNAVSGSISYDGTDKGLYIADFSGFPNMSTSVLTKTNSPIPSDTISSIAVSGNIVVIGTPKGIALRRNNIWHAITPLNSNLPPYEVKEIAIKGNELWLSISDLGRIFKADIGSLATSVEQLSSNQGITIYPNPTSNVINIHTGNSACEFTANIISFSGNLVRSQTFKGDVTIDVENIPSGLYYIRLISNEEIIYKTFIKTNH